MHAECIYIILRVRRIKKGSVEQPTIWNGPTWRTRSCISLFLHTVLNRHYGVHQLPVVHGTEGTSSFHGRGPLRYSSGTLFTGRNNRRYVITAMYTHRGRSLRPGAALSLNHWISTTRSLLHGITRHDPLPTTNLSFNPSPMLPRFPPPYVFAGVLWPSTAR